jgi:anti-sigma B factor antagonist
VDLDVRENGNICTIRLKGRLIRGEATQQFEEAFQSAQASGHIFLILGLEELPYIDSSGIGSIVNALRTSKNLGGNVRLVKPSPFVEKTLKMCSLLGLFNVYETEAEAISSYGE